MTVPAHWSQFVFWGPQESGCSSSLRPKPKEGTEAGSKETRMTVGVLHEHTVEDQKTGEVMTGTLREFRLKGNIFL